MSEAVRGMFNSLARRYDLGNDLLSLGLHRRWKLAAAARALDVARLPERSVAASAESVHPPLRILDCACGSGDVALAIARLAVRRGVGARICGLDFAAEMLEVASQRCAAWSAQSGVSIGLEQGDLLALPYSSESFDAATIAFGIRNVDDPVVGLREMARVLRRNGRVVVLETGQPANKLWRAIYNIYGHVIMEPLGALATGQREAYTYLNRTAASFPCGERFMHLMRGVELGSRPVFSSVSGRPLMGGIAWLYVAIRA